MSTFSGAEDALAMTLCSEKCDTFWSTTSELLENLLWFLHGMTDAYDNMVVQFEMSSKLLL